MYICILYSIYMYIDIVSNYIANYNRVNYCVAFWGDRLNQISKNN